MPILDSDSFSMGGGSMIKSYVYGMLVKQHEQVRSKIDNAVYVRVSTSPASIIAQVDPAVDRVNFVVDDPTSSIGTIRTMVNDVQNDNPVKWIRGQAWVRTGEMLPVEDFPRVPPPDARLHITGFDKIQFPTVDKPLYLCSMEPMGDNTWFIVATESAQASKPRLFLSTDDGLTWIEGTLPVLIASPANVKLVSDNNGRLWFHNGLTTGSTFFCTSDNGATWVTVPVPFVDVPAAIAYHNGSLYFLNATAFAVSGSVDVDLLYSTNTPASDSAVWVVTQVNNSIYAGKGHSTSQGQAPATLDICNDGTIWITTSCNDTNLPASVICYRPSLASWIAFSTRVKTLRSNTSRIINAILGTIVEDSKLRVLCFYSNSADISEAVYEPSGTASVSTLVNYYATGDQQLWSAPKARSNGMGNYCKVGKFTYSYFNFTYRVVASNTYSAGGGSIFVEGSSKNTAPKGKDNTGIAFTNIKKNRKNTVLMVNSITSNASANFVARSTGDVVGSLQASVNGLQDSASFIAAPARIDYIRVL